jgi:hypothetical protein
MTTPHRNPVFLPAVRNLLWPVMLALVPALAHAEKPSSWSDAVRAAAPQPPVFWLDSAPDRNEGTVNSGPTDYAEGKWERREEGYWADADGAFGLSASAVSGVRARATKLTDVACSENGALAVLFRTPSAFDMGEPHSILNRGDYAASMPFELSIHKGQLRLSARVNDKQKAPDLMPVAPGTWYWVALDWRRGDSTGTDVEWRVWSGGQLEKTGSLQTEGLGTTDHLLQLGGRSARATMVDGAFAQVIVWDQPVGEEGWSKLESLLAKP